MLRALVGPRMTSTNATRTALALAALLAACGDPGDAPAVGDRARSVLLVTVDTLRQDHLGAYGATLASPHLDRMAREGFRFTDAYTTAPTTLPAHTSLLTGTYPQRHGVRRNGLHRVPRETLTLAERLGDAGWTTAAFVGTAVLDSVYALDQGFDLYDDAIAPEDSAAQEQRRARRVVDAASAWLADARDPFLCWVHVFDPHGPYDPPPPYDRMYYDGDERDPAHDSLTGVPLVFYQDLEGVTDAAFPRAQYAAEVSYTDAALGDLFAALGERLDETLVIVTADHGESFGEDGVWFDHGETLSEVTVRVPLVVRAPWLGGGAVVTGAVSHVDVVPTVLDVLGLPLDGVQGISLLDAMRTGAAPERVVYFETFLPAGTRKRPLFGLRAGAHKLTLVGGRARLTDTADAPVADAPRRDELRAALEAYAARAPDVAQDELEMTPEQEAQLRALGYVR